MVAGNRRTLKLVKFGWVVFDGLCEFVVEFDFGFDCHIGDFSCDLSSSSSVEQNYE